MRSMRPLSVCRAIVPALLCSLSAFGQYKAEPAGPPPSGVAPALAKLLQPSGSKISKGGAPYAQIWLRAEKPTGGKGDEGQSLAGIPQGALLGLIQFDAPGQDRRGQGIKPGLYTLRYALIPVNGDHQGAAPQRDFVVLSPAANDSDPASTPAFEALMDMSRKASGTPHPAVLSLWKADGDATGLVQQGENDWVLQTKLGDTAVAIIIAGIASS